MDSNWTAIYSLAAAVNALAVPKKRVNAAVKSADRKINQALPGKYRWQRLFLFNSCN
jgi:hypothetical protein